MLSPDIVGPKQDPERLYDSVNILLTLQVSIISHRIYIFNDKYPCAGRDSFTCFQSKNGGVSAWEPAGAPKWLEVRTKNHKMFLNRQHILFQHLWSHNRLYAFVSVVQSHRIVLRHCDWAWIQRMHVICNPSIESVQATLPRSQDNGDNHFHQQSCALPRKHANAWWFMVH